MKHLWIPLLALLAVGCNTPERKPFDPTKPHRYRVLRGDTWQSVASKRDCEPEEVRQWNGLRESHVLIPGQVLWVFPNGDGAPAKGEHPAVAAARFFDPDGEAPTVAALPAPTDDDGVAEAPDAVDEGDATPAAAAAPAQPRSGPAPSPAPSAAPSSSNSIDGVGFGPGGTALLSLLDEPDDSPELRAVPSVTTDGSPMDSVLAGRRGDMGGGASIDNTSVDIARPKTKEEPKGPQGPSEIPTLPKAEPKTCLKANLDQDIGDYDMSAAAGLSKGAIKTGMRPVLMASQRCIPGGGNGPHELHLEVSIGCDGLVYDTRIVKTAGLPESITECVEGVADQGSFAAAAGATTFLYPVIIGY